MLAALEKRWIALVILCLGALMIVLDTTIGLLAASLATFAIFIAVT